jgi:hypothetical protein
MVPLCVKIPGRPFITPDHERGSLFIGRKAMLFAVMVQFEILYREERISRKGAGGAKEDAKKSFKIQKLPTPLRPSFAPLRLCGKLFSFAIVTRNTFQIRHEQRP